MDKKAALLHILICIVIGGVISFFTSVKWLAASFWVSAAMFINGSIAAYEDALRGGFDNPDGQNTPDFVKGFGALKYWVSSIAISAGLATAGFIIQKYAWWSW